MDPITVTLKYPVTTRLRGADAETREETVTSVTVRRPKGRDLKAMDKHAGKNAQMLALIAAVTGLRADQVDEMDGEDITTLGTLVGDFFPDAPKTGEAS